MQHIAEEVVGEEQAEATFKSLHWEQLRSWMRGVDEGGVTFSCSGVDEPGGGSWSCTAATPLPREVSITTATNGDQGIPSGGHREDQVDENCSVCP